MPPYVVGHEACGKQLIGLQEVNVKAEDTICLFWKKRTAKKMIAPFSIHGGSARYLQHRPYVMVAAEAPDVIRRMRLMTAGVFSPGYWFRSDTVRMLVKVTHRGEIPSRYRYIDNMCSHC